MKITFTSDTGVFKPQTYMDQHDFKLERGVYPTTNEIYKAEGDSVYFLTNLTGFTAMPSKTLLRTDRPQADGTIHYGALYKAAPFTITCRRNELIRYAYKDLYRDRGLFTIEATHAGVTVTSKVTTMEVPDDYSLTFDSPSMLFDVIQDQRHDPFTVFQAYTSVYPHQLLYAQNDEYAFTGGAGNSTNITSQFDIVVRETGEYELHILDMTVPGTMVIKNINGVGCNVVANITTDSVVSFHADGTVWCNAVQIGTVAHGGWKSFSNAVTYDITYSNNEPTYNVECTIQPRAMSDGTGLQMGGFVWM